MTNEYDEFAAERNRLGEFVRTKRIELGEAQTAFAKRAGIGQQTLSAIESGVRMGTIGTRRKIAAALGVPLHELMAASGDWERYAAPLAEIVGIDLDDLKHFSKMLTVTAPLSHP